jgi:hypothetical protein
LKIPHHELPKPKRKSRMPKLGSMTKELSISFQEYKHSEETKTQLDRKVLKPIRSSLTKNLFDFGSPMGSD